VKTRRQGSNHPSVRLQDNSPMKPDLYHEGRPPSASAQAKVAAARPTTDNWDDENHGSVSNLAELDVVLAQSSPSWIDQGYG
jgi:hypothetical protein